MFVMARPNPEQRDQPETANIHVANIMMTNDALQYLMISANAGIEITQKYSLVTLRQRESILQYCNTSSHQIDLSHVVVVDPTPPTCCQQSPAPASCGSQQSLPPGGKERLHFVGIRPEVQARKGGW